jgi:hypothetical protein
MNYALQRSAESPMSNEEPRSIAARKETKAGAAKKKTKKK